MKKLLALLLIISMLLLGLAACSTPNDGGTSDDTPEGEKPDGDGSTPDGEEPADACEYASTRSTEGRNVAIVTMKIKNYGNVKLLLDATSAPVTVANFLSLAKAGFYDGLGFYSAQQLSETASVIISGAASGNGSGGSYEKILGECSGNGYNGNDLSHKHGVISMLHSDYSYDDATSHFFFVGGDDLSGLDGYYAPFGYVTEGLPIINEIIEYGVYYTQSTGLIAANRQPKIESVTVEQDIDYSLIRDKYIVPPMPDELNMAHESTIDSEQISAGFAHSSVRRIYPSRNGGYVFQIAEETENGFVNLLLAITADGVVGNLTSVSDSEMPHLDGWWESLYEKTLAEIKTLTDIPEELKIYSDRAFRALDAIKSDGSASKYVYTRDTDDRDTYLVEMKVKGYDTPVVILLDKTTAPVTVENFLSLVKAGFYDGLDFHRIIKGFMIQGGSDADLPEEEQAASIKGEFASNGHANDILHLRGTISMARTNDPNSASSGFFICDADSPHLDGNYAAFGYVLSGMVTVDAIADYAVGNTDNNGNLIENEEAGIAHPVIESIKLISAE